MGAGSLVLFIFLVDQLCPPSRGTTLLFSSYVLLAEVPTLLFSSYVLLAEVPHFCFPSYVLLAEGPHFGFQAMSS